ncbi:kinase-like domain-containing protein [Mycena latifolia]|nr:kinase-like domain-containing protein [Mycena latifolia]
MDASMNDVANALNAGVYSQGDLSQMTQPISQPSQLIDSDFENDLDAKSWGLLIPCGPGMERLRFFKTDTQITIGRDPSNKIVLLWNCISEDRVASCNVGTLELILRLLGFFHAVITWNGQENGSSEVTIEDKSRNGTYLKDERIGAGKMRLLSDGSEVSFVRPGRPGRPRAEIEPDYRFTYRDLVSEQRELYKKYDLAFQLGQGSYAKVYKALQKGTGKWVAVKMLNPTMRHNPPVGDAPLIREITTMQRLQHPNVCALLDYFLSPNGSIDLVVEYVDGGNLHSFINRTSNGLTDWMSCHLTFQICKALAYIHRCKITHRDLKPENIILTQKTPPIVKIADFGLAKLVDENTALRTMCGTPTYIAPEIITRDSTDVTYTNLVDSWSVGVIVFFMFTKQTPFPNVPQDQLRELILKQSVDWRYLEENVSEPGYDFVRALLEFDPADRMTVENAQHHRWLVAQKPTYDLEYPDAEAGDATSRTASLNSGGSNPSGLPQHPVPKRAPTADPYADDDPLPPNPRNGHARLHPLEESQDLPNAGPVEQRGEVLQRAVAQGLAPSQDSEEFMFGAAAAPVLQPDPVEMQTDGDALKRMFADVHMPGSSPLSSEGSPPPPTKKMKIAKTARAEPKPKGNATASSGTRKTKGKKRDDPDIDKTTATRRSTRAVRPVKR